MNKKTAMQFVFQTAISGPFYSRSVYCIVCKYFLLVRSTIDSSNVLSKIGCQNETRSIKLMALIKGGDGRPV